MLEQLICTIATVMSMVNTGMSGVLSSKPFLVFLSISFLSWTLKILLESSNDNGKTFLHPQKINQHIKIEEQHVATGTT
jgi:hypothetical protein